MNVTGKTEFDQIVEWAHSASRRSHQTINIGRKIYANPTVADQRSRAVQPERVQTAHPEGGINSGLKDRSGLLAEKPRSATPQGTQQAEVVTRLVRPNNSCKPIHFAASALANKIELSPCQLRNLAQLTCQAKRRFCGPFD